VKAPVKLIYGQNDWSTLTERDNTAKQLGGISISTVANTGHFAFVDNPEKITAILLAN
jgi:pimeloyl-ACP methyl ester carboxylesterase